MSGKIYTVLPKTVVAARNACGIGNKRNQLVQFLQDHGMDAMLMGETWLRQENNLEITNCKVLRSAVVEVVALPEDRGSATSFAWFQCIEHLFHLCFSRLGF